MGKNGLRCGEMYWEVRDVREDVNKEGRSELGFHLSTWENNGSPVGRTQL
jgi:hypothetical protein